MDDNSISDTNSEAELSQKKTSTSAAYEMVPLLPGFEPTELDVICARYVHCTLLPCQTYAIHIICHLLLVHLEVVLNLSQSGA